MKPSELIADEKNWCKGANARTAEGLSALAWSDEACCWCLIGALSKCYVDSVGVYTVATNAVRKVIGLKGFPNLSSFNDDPETTHEQVIAVLKEAGL